MSQESPKISISAPRYWIALVMITLFLGGLIYQLASIDLHVRSLGYGQVLYQNGIDVIRSPREGQVEKILVDINQPIKIDTPIVELSIENEEIEIDHLAAEISGLKKRLRVLSRYKKTQAVLTEIFTLEREIALRQAFLGKLKEELKRHQTIRSPYEGTLIELSVTEGDHIQEKRALGRVSDRDVASDLIAFVYVSREEATHIEPGMPVHFHETKHRFNSNIHVMGVVESVSDYPISEAAVLNYHQRASFWDRLQTISSPTLVRVRIPENDVSVLVSGQIIYADVIIKTQRLIDYLRDVILLSE